MYTPTFVASSGITFNPASPTANWAAPNFDDSKWPRAYEYTDEDIGVTTLKAYTNFPELFEGARWIWSLNLVFDNLVLARKTVR